MFKIKFRSIRFFLLSFFIVTLQSTIVHAIAINHVMPDLILLLVVFFALYNGSKQGMFYAMITGLFADALSGGVIGINSFALGCVGYACGLLKERVYTNHLLTKFLVVFCAGILNTSIYYMLALQFYKLPGFWENFANILGVIIYSAVFNIFFADMLDKAVIERSTSLL
jgi:rod shape-determining protein MreD